MSVFTNRYMGGGSGGKATVTITLEGTLNYISGGELKAEFYPKNLNISVDVPSIIAVYSDTAGTVTYSGSAQMLNGFITSVGRNQPHAMFVTGNCVIKYPTMI